MSMPSWIFHAPRRGLMLLVQGYRLLLSAWLGSSCRFTPTCSAYALQALEHHGAVAGTGLTLRRLARCHPWCRGGHDPVPSRNRGMFTGLATGTDTAGPCVGLSSPPSRFNSREEKTRP